MKLILSAVLLISSLAFAAPLPPTPESALEIQKIVTSPELIKQFGDMSQITEISYHSGNWMVKTEAGGPGGKTCELEVKVKFVGLGDPELTFGTAHCEPEAK